MTLFILFVDSPSLIVLSTGIPPPTAASNSKLTLFFSAKIDRASPFFAMTALFAVITCFLFFKASIIIFFEIPSESPISSKMISTLGFLTISNGFL